MIGFPFKSITLTQLWTTNSQIVRNCFFFSLFFISMLKDLWALMEGLTLFALTNMIRKSGIISWLHHRRDSSRSFFSIYHISIPELASESVPRMWTSVEGLRQTTGKIPTGGNFIWLYSCCQRFSVYWILPSVVFFSLSCGEKNKVIKGFFPWQCRNRTCCSAPNCLNRCRAPLFSLLWDGLQTLNTYHLMM